MIEALTSILTFLANVCIDIGAFFTNIIIEKNYITLAAILVGFVLLGIAIGIIKAKIKHTRRF